MQTLTQKTRYNTMRIQKINIIKYIYIIIYTKIHVYICMSTPYHASCLVSTSMEIHTWKTFTNTIYRYLWTKFTRGCSTHDSCLLWRRAFTHDRLSLLRCHCHATSGTIHPRHKNTKCFGNASQRSIIKHRGSTWCENPISSNHTASQWWAKHPVYTC